MMNEGRGRVTAWPRLALAQSAHDVMKLRLSAISECHCTSNEKYRGRLGADTGVIGHLRW
jgi:hypothetical protein